MKYWVVGAMFGGSDDAFDVFIKRGYWYCWDPRANISDELSILRQQEKVRQIEPGDRIAIKKMLGQGSSEIEIRSIGIVEDVDHDEWRIYVKWVEIFGEGNRRLVAIKGAAASIHGPYEYEEPWVQQIFCL
jgi:hypothetical protein